LKVFKKLVSLPLSELSTFNFTLSTALICGQTTKNGKLDGVKQINPKNKTRQHFAASGF